MPKPCRLPSYGQSLLEIVDVVSDAGPLALVVFTTLFLDLTVLPQFRISLRFADHVTT
jgi:hypothetical protein